MPSEKIAAHKLVIYQLFVRYFGNQNSTNKINGSIEENGCGKFNDINEEALTSLKELGINCIWFTGVIEHATMSDYTKYGIKMDDPDVVKGRAGSPYAIKDYYDVSPDLAVDVENRMTEFEALVERTHYQDLKVLIDFVPNHVARTYYSDVKPSHIEDLGEMDNVAKGFDTNNDFYYIPNEPFRVPSGYQAGGTDFHHQFKDGYFDEFPAKATGNDVFKATPSIDDWFETIKLNYGVDYENGKSKNFVPHPPLWKKMLDILLFWASKGVDGFRCDMVEMVPVEFWNWAISSIKKKYPSLIFIGEAYNTAEYSNFLFNGKFDYLYDKVGVYDSLRRLIVNDHHGSTADISNCEKATKDFGSNMLHFLENHDEQRIASSAFAGNPWLAIPGMIVSATLSSGPLMIYNGQEVGEQAYGAQGFSGNDGRSSIFDYCNMPRHEKWVNGGSYDGGKLNQEEQSLRGFYGKLLHLAGNHPAISFGDYCELSVENLSLPKNDHRVYAFLRYFDQHRVLVIVNFNRYEVSLKVTLPENLITKFDLEERTVFTDLLSRTRFEADDIQNGLIISMPATSGVMLGF